MKKVVSLPQECTPEKSCAVKSLYNLIVGIGTPYHADLISSKVHIEFKKYLKKGSIPKGCSMF